MVGVLIRLKLDVLRHSTTGLRSALTIVGLVLGMLLAVGTVLLGALDFTGPGVAINLLCVGFLIWTIGWVVGPLVTGGDTTLNPGYFTLLPIPPRQLATSLIGASFVGVAPVVTLVAFLSLVVGGAKLGVASALVGVVAVPLQLALVILLSKVLVGARGEAEKSRLGKEVSALVMGFGFAFLVLGPLTLSTLWPVLVRPWPSVAATIVRALPSSWGAVAVDAAQRSDWLLAVGALAGLVVFCALLLAIWGRLLVRATTEPAGHAKIAAAGRAGLVQRMLPDSPLGTSIGKELRTWSRDMLRGRFLRMAFWTGTFICVAIALTAGWFILAFLGVLVAIFAGAMCGNLYGTDGTALWLTLMTPGTERADVRGRQLAWLIRVAPLVLGVTVVGYLIAGESWTLPLVIAVIPALLGGGAGWVLLVSVLAPIVKSDPHRRSSNPGDAGNNVPAQVMQSQITFYLTTASMLPAAAVVVAGMLLDSPAVEWAGSAVGLCTGLLLPWLLGRIAYRRLIDRGPELLNVLRKGPPVKQVKSAGQEEDGAPGEVVAADEEPRPSVPGVGKAVLLWCVGGFFVIIEGLIPLIAVLAGAGFESRFWYVPVYFPKSLHLPVAVAFLVVGALMVLGGFLVMIARRRKIARLDAEEADAALPVAESVGSSR